MKNIFYILTAILFLSACAEGDKETTETSTEVKEEVVTSTKVKYNAPTYAEGEVASIASQITYPVIIKNPDKTDDWTEECLKDIDIKAFAGIFYKLIYSEKLKAYPYMSDEPMTIKEVKEFEKEYSRDRIAKVLFEEEWVFDENKMQMYKKVNSIMLAYELYYESGEVKGYKAGVQVYLNK